jgi:chromosome segregation ATPase
MASNGAEPVAKQIDEARATLAALQKENEDLEQILRQIQAAHRKCERRLASPELGHSPADADGVPQ